MQSSALGEAALCGRGLFILPERSGLSGKKRYQDLKQENKRRKENG